MRSLIRETVSKVLKNHGSSERIAQLADYIDGLEDERRKIDPFKNELPLFLTVIEMTIVSMKEELMRYEKTNSIPVLEEVVTLKKIAEEEHENFENNEDKMNWMRSVQLWNSDNQHLDDTQESKTDNIKSCKNRIAGTTLCPLKRCTDFQVLPVEEENKDESIVLPELALGTPEAKGRLETMNSSAFSSKSICNRSDSNVSTDNHWRLSQQIRKRRRCWSPELHRRFIDALKELGGAQAATPKQIREVMRVDGLSNDEVKSHLQKYRIHTRSRFQVSTNANRPIVLGASSTLSQDQCFESSKQINSRPGSPQCLTHKADVLERGRR